MKYFTLLARDEDGRWCIEFGDYDRNSVEDELEDYRYRGFFKRNLKIIETDDDARSIATAVQDLNDG